MDLFAMLENVKVAPRVIWEAIIIAAILENFISRQGLLVS